MTGWKVSKRRLDDRAGTLSHALVPTEGGPRAQALANAVVPQNDVHGYVTQLTKLWSEAQEKFLVIGRYLILAKESLPHGEFEEMVRNQLPFGRSVAHKLRAVARDVREGRLELETLPRTYMTAYALTVLDDSELMVARNRGLVREDVMLREIEAFKREVRAPVGRHRRDALNKERDRIEAEIERMRARLAEIEREVDGGEAHVDATASD